MFDSLLPYPMDCSTPGFSVHHQIPELAQTHGHWVGDAIQPSCLVIPFFCLQSFSSSGSFRMSQMVNLKELREFPGGSMVRTQDFHCYAPRSNHWPENLNWGVQRKKKKKCWDFGKFHGLSEACKWRLWKAGEIWLQELWLKGYLELHCCSVSQSYSSLCHPMYSSTSGLSVPHHLLKFAQVYVHLELTLAYDCQVLLRAWAFMRGLV